MESPGIALLTCTIQYPVMKSANKRPSKTMKAVKRKSSARSAAIAIGKKVEEIKRESKQSHAVINNISLFGYRV